MKKKCKKKKLGIENHKKTSRDALSGRLKKGRSKKAREEKISKEQNSRNENYTKREEKKGAYGLKRTIRETAGERAKRRKVNETGKQRR